MKLLLLVLFFITLLPNAYATHGQLTAVTFVTGEQDFTDRQNVPIQFIVKNNSEDCMIITNPGVAFTSSSAKLLPKDAPKNVTSYESVELEPDRHQAFTINMNFSDAIPGTYTIYAFATALTCEEGYHDMVFINGPRLALNVKPQPENQCIIATAAFGSQLAPQVQFLREFRDDIVMSTYSGSSFITLFNAFYYSWSPHVADIIRDSDSLKSVSRILITPLLGILTLSSSTQENSDTAIISSGIMSAMLIGAVYLTPLGIGSTFALKKKIRKHHLMYLAIAWAATLFLTTTATMLFHDLFMMASSTLLVLSSIALAAVGLTFCFDMVWNHKKKFAT